VLVVCSGGGLCGFGVVGWEDYFVDYVCDEVWGYFGGVYEDLMYDYCGEYLV